MGVDHKWEDLADWLATLLLLDTHCAGCGCMVVGWMHVTTARGASALVCVEE